MTLAHDPIVTDWSNPWKLTITGVCVARFASAKAIYAHFFGSNARWTLDPTLASQLRELLALHGVTHEPDPRRRSAAELESLPAGAKLSYYGQGESFVAEKQADGTWMSTCAGGSFAIAPPMMSTFEVK